MECFSHDERGPSAGSNDRSFVTQRNEVKESIQRRHGGAKGEKPLAELWLLVRCTVPVTTA